MKERPILFSGQMVTAIREGKKTQTRRIVSAKDAEFFDCLATHADDEPGQREDLGQRVENNQLRVWCAEYPEEGSDTVPIRYGGIGDRLWVREAFNLFDGEGKEWPKGNGLPKALPEGWHVTYAEECTPDAREVFRFRPSIHMPRWASRMTIEITSVHIERIREITGQGVLAEGVEFPDAEHYLKAAQRWNPWIKLWDSINGEGSWVANPWVWVVGFKQIEQQQKAAA